MSSRDKESTKRKILQSVRSLLENGDGEIGINRVAEEAGLDKVLIYRYFGGLSGLLAAFAQEENVWPEFEEIMEAAPYVAAMLPPEDIAARFVHGFIRELRDRPITQQILRWELTRENDLTRETASVREQRMSELLECHDAHSPEDIPALYAIVTAGLIHLMLHAKSPEQFCGISLRTPEDWERIKRAAIALIENRLTQNKTGSQ